MKKLTQLLALALALCLVLSLTACGSGIAGTWKYEMDLAKMMEAAAGDEDLSESLGGMADTLKTLYDGLSMKLVLDLKPDKTFTFGFDKESAKAAAEGMLAKLGDVLPAMIAESMGVSLEELNEQLEEAGMTMDALISLSIGALDVDDLVDQFTGENMEGTYRYEDGKLYLTEKDAEEDPNSYLVVEVSGSELRVTDVSSNEDGSYDNYKALLPLVFTK